MIKLEFQFYPIDEVTERLFDKEFCYIGNRVGERLWAFYGTKKEIDEKMSSLGLVILPYKEEYIDNSKILIRVKYKEIKAIADTENYYKCYICGENCGKKDPKLTGNPRIYHLECAEKETKEIRERVLNRKKI